MKVERVVLEALPAERDDKYYLGRFKSSAISKFYLKNLKRYAFFKYFSHLFWDDIFPACRRLFKSLKVTTSGRRYPLCPQSHRPEAAERKVLARATEVTLTRPAVFPSAAAGVVGPDTRSQPQLGFSIARYRDAVLLGGSNIFLAGEQAICHDLYDFDRDYTSEELHGRMKVSLQPKAVRIPLWPRAASFPYAATFLDACASNYAHWLTEVLPRIAVFCQQEEYRGCPIVINENLHKNIVDSIECVVDPERRVVMLPVGAALPVDDLLVTSPSGYISFQPRGALESHSKHGVFCPYSLQNMVSACMGRLGVSQNLPRVKVAIRRNSGYRLVTNASEIEAWLVSQGFILVEPEKLSFVEQVRLFERADVVVGATGAAFANLLFARPGSHMVILFSQHEAGAYLYWQNMAASVGVQVTNVLGKMKGAGDGAHGDFSVELEDVQKALRVQDY